MPFTRSTLQELRDQGIAEINTRLPGADALLRRSNLEVLSRVQAGGIHELLGYLDFIADQVIIDSAEAEFLERHAAIWGVARKAAVPATGTVDLTGTDNSVIPAGTVLQSGNSLEFVTNADTVIVAGAGAAPIDAREPGVAGNLAAGVTLTMVSPIGGVSATGTVAAGGLAGGVDSETDDSLRARLLDRIRQPPHGGAAFDYNKWALEVAGVTRAFVFPQEQGLGSVVVRFVVDDDPAGPIPSAAKVQEVQDYIDARRPVTADLTVLAPVAVALDMTITLTPNVAAVQAAVTAELTDLLLREAEPGATILLSHIREAISTATGETDHVLVAPAADVTHTPSQMPVLGTITYQ